MKTPLEKAKFWNKFWHDAMIGCVSLVPVAGLIGLFGPSTLFALAVWCGLGLALAISVGRYASTSIHLAAEQESEDLKARIIERKKK